MKLIPYYKQEDFEFLYINSDKDITSPNSNHFTRLNVHNVCSLGCIRRFVE